MALTPGRRLGVYEVTEPLGEGGMGQVWRATDTTLGRQVAIKILPDAFASDPERLARFEREAKTLASLNHPHIAAIYGFEKSPSTGSGQAAVSALVMELVEGEDLSQRIARGAIPLDEALPIAKQIAEALEAAHEQGIIHRDLKPANIKVREDGTVKVLDFGLAKAMDPSPSSPNVSRSPTITSPAMTLAGVIMGTAAYMSPEQARGKTVDKRSDIWAFGCVLFEMLTRTRAFDGEEITDVMMAVMRDEPNWSLLPADTPTSIRRLLRRSLTKDRKRRLSDMTDVRIELEDTVDEPTTAKAPASRRREWIWAAVALAALLGIAAIGVRARLAPALDSRIVRFEVSPPPGYAVETGQSLSPDGRMLAYVLRAEGKSQMWVRSLDSASARALAGTDGATRYFWSPDGRYVAFFQDGNLKKVAITGERPELIANGPFRDGAWSKSGTILLGGQVGRGLFRVSELGGQPVAETTLDTSRREVSHDYPEFLPDGRHYIYLARHGIQTNDLDAYIGTLGDKERRPLTGINAGVKYSPSGHLLFLRGGTLMAQTFNVDRLELSGEAFPIAEQVAGGVTAAFSASRNGTLSYVGGVNPESMLTWFDRSGNRQHAGSSAIYENVALSPDGRFVAFDRLRDVWVLDLERSIASKATSDPDTDRSPVWSPDGQRLAFGSGRGGAPGLYELTVGTAGSDRLLLRSDLPVTPSDWSRDGKFLLYAANGDLWALPLPGGAKPLQLTSTPVFNEIAATFSPDSRWIAYQSNESNGVTRFGSADVYVRSFPQLGFRSQVSTGGGFQPRWSADGKELFYLTPDDSVTSVTVTPRGSSLDFGKPRVLFRLPLGGPSTTPSARYALGRDGRLLMREGGSTLSLTVILNWFEQLKGGREP